MKATDVPKIDKAWWDKNKPATLKSTGLGKAMADYQAAKSAAIKSAAKSPTDFEGATGAFETADHAFAALEGAARKAVGACNKVLHGDCITVLNNLIKSVLPAEERVLAGLRQEFEKDVKGEVARFKGACDAMQARSSKLASDAESDFDGVVRLEDELEDIRDTAGKAKQAGNPVNPKNVARAQQIAASIEATLRKLTSDLRTSTTSINANFKELFHPGLATIDKSLARAADRIMMPLDVIENKFLPQLEASAARAKKAATGIEGLASGAADLRAEYLDMLEAFVERGVRRSDGISGNLRSAGGKLDGADQNLMNYEEAAPGQADKGIVEHATKLLKEGIQEVKVTEASLKEFQKSLNDFTSKMPAFVEPKSVMFRGPLNELIKLNSGAAEDAAELKKLSAKAAKVGVKLKQALATAH